MDKTSQLVRIINRIHNLEDKLRKEEMLSKVTRQMSKIWEEMTSLNLIVENPLGEQYDITRSDCEASIAGNETSNMVIVDVIKPVVYLKNNGNNELVQRGVIIVESK